jgi:single-stranded-DNA-specific exonuclease
MLWIEEEVDEEKVDSFSSLLSVSNLLARLLLLRGINGAEQANRFLEPKLAHLADPFDLPGLKDAVLRISQALSNKEKVLLIGDYDVDGITSTVIVKQNLLNLGMDPHYVIPKRKDEGYGLTSEVLNRGLQLADFKLVIALDCGTNSCKQADELKDKGIDLIIVDHHQAKGDLPTGAIMLNPHLHPDQGEPWRNLCTAGLAFKLIHGLLKHLREKKVDRAFEVNPAESLSLAALGTIADLVPLKGENRILARFGLKHLGNKPSIGLQALLEESGLKLGSSPEIEDVTFKLAPRINACGRLDDAEVAASLMLESDLTTSRKLAKQMNLYNQERKAIEAQLTEHVLELAEQKFSDKPAVVVCGKGEAWNPGVVGIVAGKMSNALGKPCIVLACADDGAYRGSGRGVQGLNLVDALSKCQELLTHWGGHPVAVGLTVEKDNLELFTKAFVAAVDTITGGKISPPSLRITSTIEQSDLRPELLYELIKMAPFGQENQEPVLALKNIRLAQKPRTVGDGSHFQFSVHNGSTPISGIAWKMSSRMPPSDQNVDLAFRLKWNIWNGRRNLQMELQDWKLSVND